MNEPKSRWPTLPQWTLIFTVCTWIVSLVTAGVTISIFCWIVRHSARVIVPSILIAFLAGQPMAAQLSTYDQAGNVTLILQQSQHVGQWQDSPWKVILNVDKATMLGKTATVYSNATQVASFTVEAPAVPGQAQVINLTDVIQIPTTNSSGFIQWRIPIQDLSQQGIQPQGTIVVLVCGMTVLVVGGIVIYEVVKLCNRIADTNTPPANANSLR